MSRSTCTIAGSSSPGSITWSLATGYFPNAYPQLPGQAYWVLGAVTAMLLPPRCCCTNWGTSLALRERIPVRGVTLFIFGGVAQITARAADPPAPSSASPSPARSPAWPLAALFGHSVRLLDQLQSLAWPRQHLST